jgi:hypothetical protein
MLYADGFAILYLITDENRSGQANKVHQKQVQISAFFLKFINPPQLAITQVRIGILPVNG